MSALTAGNLRPVSKLTNKEILMRHGLRRLDPADFKTSLVTVDPGAPPPIILVDIWRLFVNEDYQRDLSKASFQRIAHIAQNWDWSKYTPISIVRADQALIDELGEEAYEVLDGQHESIAAANNGFIRQLPAILKTSETLQEKATAFIGINSKRLALTAAAKFHAELASGDEKAIAVQCALSFAGCTLLEQTPQKRGKFKVGETLALASMKQVIRSRSEADLVRVLRIAKAGECAPISAAMIKALSFMLSSPDAASSTFDTSLSSVIKGLGARRLEIQAKGDNPDMAEYSALAELLFAKAGISKPVATQSRYMQGRTA